MRLLLRLLLRFLSRGVFLDDPRYIPNAIVPRVRAVFHENSENDSSGGARLVIGEGPACGGGTDGGAACGEGDATRDLGTDGGAV